MRAGWTQADADAYEAQMRKSYAALMDRAHPKPPQYGTAEHLARLKAMTDAEWREWLRKILP